MYIVFFNLTKNHSNSNAPLQKEENSKEFVSKQMQFIYWSNSYIYKEINTILIGVVLSFNFFPCTLKMLILVYL